jgi:hypothetical protein
MMEGFTVSESVTEEVIKPKAPKAKANGTAKPEKKATPKKAAKAPVPKADVDKYGLQKGSLRSKAVAMYARKSGATLEEVKTTVGSIQLNILRTLKRQGYTVEQEKQNRKEGRPVMRYWLRAK